MGIQKALAALLTSLITLGALFGMSVPQEIAGEQWIQALSAVIAPLLVWLVPNKES